MFPDWLLHCVGILHWQHGLDIVKAEQQVTSAVWAWCQHPDFFEVHHRNPWYPGGRYGRGDPASCIVLGVFTHEPGKENRTESYVISGLADVLGSIPWGERTLGQFSSIRPVPHSLTVDPVVTMRIGHYSFSYKGGGKAYASRMVLKKMLPRKVRRLIQECRKMYARPKYWWLPYFYDNYDDPDLRARLKERKVHRRPSLQPPTYRQATKRELLVIYWLKEEDAQELSKVIVPLEFIRAATGFYHPNEVPHLITHQLTF